MSNFNLKLEFKDIKDISLREEYYYLIKHKGCITPYWFIDNEFVGAYNNPTLKKEYVKEQHMYIAEIPRCF